MSSATKMLESLSFKFSLFPKLPFSKPQFPIPCHSAKPKPKPISTVRSMVLVSDGPKTSTSPMTIRSIEVVDNKAEEMKETTRRTKIVCTIGPRTCEFDELESLAIGGMNVARINMCHNTREWHRAVIERVKRLNDEKGFAVAVMMDTQGTEINMGDLDGAASAKAEDGEFWTFSVRAFNSPCPERTISVNYDGFVEDARVGDELLVDGGMVRFVVTEKIGPDVICECTDPGLLLPRANLTFWRNGSLVQEHSAMLPTISPKDWLDIDFGIEAGVDFIAVSFVKSAVEIKHLKSYTSERSPDRDIRVIAKIESVDSLMNLEEIIAASDGAMVARGDLGAQIPLEQVPSVQEKIVHLCRQLNKPVIVASQLLESMIEYPIPTRAEVADVSEAVRQQADAIMLSGESAAGQFPDKALAVLTGVSLRMERWWREEKNHDTTTERKKKSSPMFGGISGEMCSAAAKMANKLEADALFVYTKTGEMASLLSSNRPKCPIFAFTPSPTIQRQLNLQWGLVPFCLEFSKDVESNQNRSFALLKAKGMIKSGDLIVVVSVMLRSIQIIRIP